jgi:hypothetical protein
MSESTIRAGILASLATVSGIKSNLGEWPTSMAVPGLFTLMAEITYPVTAGWNVDLYGFETNLLVAWQDNGVAENTLIAFTPPLYPAPSELCRAFTSLAAPPTRRGRFATR